MEPSMEGRRVRNRDVALMRHVVCMIQDVVNTEKKRQFLQDRLWNMTQRITGMPGGGGRPTGMEEQFALIDELEEKYRKDSRETLEKLSRAEEILNNDIRENEMRTFVTMRYLLDMGNAEIMKRLNIRRRRFEYLCRIVEEAPRMRDVRWPGPEREEEPRPAARPGAVRMGRGVDVYRH